MPTRLVSVALLALITAGSSGCTFIYCLHDNLIGAYKSRRWADCGCGEVYYGPWIDTPPACCDPCDNCGSFHGKRYWTSANSWLNDSRQSYNPWPWGNAKPNNAGAPGNAGVPTDAPMMDAPAMGAPVFDDSLDGVPLQGETIGPGRQGSMQPSPAPMNQMNQPYPAGPQMNSPQQGPPPSYYPSPRTGRRQRGLARTPNPYNNNQVAPAGYNY